LKPIARAFFEQAMLVATIAVAGTSQLTVSERDQPVFLRGNPLRFVFANSTSCLSLIEFAIWRDAPLRLAFDRSPRFAASAAPAAICCFFDLAGIWCSPSCNPRSHTPVELFRRVQVPPEIAAMRSDASMTRERRRAA
jgi:hypothetical protein